MQATATVTDYLSFDYNLTIINVLSTPDELRERRFLLSSSYGRAATQTLSAGGGYSHKGKDTQAHCTHHDRRVRRAQDSKK
jgi:hypothetical protein